MLFRGPDRMTFTIRSKILLAFLGLTVITGALGFVALRIVIETSRLALQTYDMPLSTVSHARKAEADFTAMRLAYVHREASADAGQRAQFDVQLGQLAHRMEEDLAVWDAIPGPAAGAAHSVLDDFRQWDDLRRQAPDGPAMRDAMERRVDAVMDGLEVLRHATADDLTHDRTTMIASIERYRVWSITATGLALIIATFIGAVLARHMISPIAEASRAAGRIAAGDLKVEILPSGSDELGQLLAAMSAMRDNIQAMMEREIAERRTAQARLANAIKGVKEGIALVGCDGRVFLTNARLAEFFAPPDPRIAEGATLPAEIEAILASATGEMHTAAGRWLRLTRSDVPEGGFVLIACDITGLKEREADLQAAKEEAESANRAKTQFLANMSHELRTPLTAIIGFSEIIASESLGAVGQPQYREFADDILHSGRHLLSVINDMLDIAKLQSGMTRLRLQPVPASSIVDGAVRIVRKKAEQSGVRLDLAIPDHLPVIEADHLRLRQVLLNLLSNAIKFTPPGGTVSVSAERRAAGVAIIVRDTGIGMAPEDIPRALEPFVQVENGLARQYTGTGLGLPLSKLFVELHGGQLVIDSTPGTGTIVTMVLPAVTMDSSADTDTREQAA